MLDFNEKSCLACGVHIQGRRDKKFCSDQCRSSHYNRMHFENAVFIKRIDRQLKKNWRILHELNPTGTRKVREDDLRLNGFDFKYFTSIHRTHNGTCHYYCYNYSYVAVGKGEYLLVTDPQQ